MNRNEVKFKFVFADDYEPEYVNGVYGGINSNGELVINFIMDRMAIPNSITQKIKDDGTLDDLGIEIEPEEPMVRRNVKSGVIMTPETALALYNWLKGRLIEMGVENDKQ